MKETLAMVLAGGKGTRLGPLSADRAKPAVPFGGNYRIIDFVLNNLINSGIYRIKVLTQFKADSLIRHLSTTYNLSRALGMYVDPVPAQMRRGEEWYRGTADAIYQNSNLIEDENPALVAIFGGDHVYKMDIAQMVRYHKEKVADLTVAAIPMPISQGSSFGVIEVDADWRITGFTEKPEQPKSIPGNPEFCLASMGNYIFTTDVLLDELTRDAPMDSAHDFGKDIIPQMVDRRNVYVYDFAHNSVPGASDRDRGYWRDVGTVDSYYDANMDLRSVSPAFNLYNRLWPIRTYPHTLPPAKFVFDDSTRRGMGIDSMISEGCIISGGCVVRSILSPGCFIHSYSLVEDSILFDNVDIGRHARLRRVIVDKNTKIPEGCTIGYDINEDRRRFFVSDTGVVVLPKNAQF